MRKILTLAVLSVTCLSGCGLMGDKRRCGIHFEVLCPPIVETTTPVLVQNGGQQVTAHPMGTLAGPVTEGRSIHAPVVPNQTIPQAMPSRQGVTQWGDCGPVLPQSGRYTLDELKALKNALHAIPAEGSQKLH